MVRQLTKKKPRFTRFGARQLIKEMVLSDFNNVKVYGTKVRSDADDQFERVTVYVEHAPFPWLYIGGSTLRLIEKQTGMHINYMASAYLPGVSASSALVHEFMFVREKQRTRTVRRRMYSNG